MPKVLWPSGVDTIIQSWFHWNSIFIIAPASSTTAPTVWWGTLTAVATMSLAFTASSSNRWTATARKRFATSTVAWNQTWMRTAYTQWFVGNAPWFWGFFFRAQFWTATNINGSQLFIGLCASTALLAATAWAVSALTDMCGVWYDTTDPNTGNRQFYRNNASGSAVKVDIVWAPRNTTDWYDLVMFNAPNSNILYVRIVNLTTGVTVLDTSYNTEIPTVNVWMAFKADTNNGAVASAQSIDVAKVYIETDY
jgi:hypothetical protein